MHTKEGLGALTGGDNVCTGFDAQFRWCACVRVSVCEREREGERERETEVCYLSWKWWEERSGKRNLRGWFLLKQPKVLGERC